VTDWIARRGCHALAAVAGLAAVAITVIVSPGRDVRGAVIPVSGHNIAPENPAAPAQAYLDFFAGG
jgi:hypothetical protein